MTQGGHGASLPWQPGLLRQEGIPVCSGTVKALRGSWSLPHPRGKAQWMSISFISPRPYPPFLYFSAETAQDSTLKMFMPLSCMWGNSQSELNTHVLWWRKGSIRTGIPSLLLLFSGKRHHCIPGTPDYSPSLSEQPSFSQSVTHSTDLKESTAWLLVKSTKMLRASYGRNRTRCFLTTKKMLDTACIPRQRMPVGGGH